MKKGKEKKQKRKGERKQEKSMGKGKGKRGRKGNPGPRPFFQFLITLWAHHSLMINSRRCEESGAEEAGAEPARGAQKSAQTRAVTD